MSDERNFSDTYARLSEIADEVSSDDISLDEALALYEEAVTLGLAACDLSEQDIFIDEDADGIDAASVTGGVADGAVDDAGSQHEAGANGSDSPDAPSSEEAPAPNFQ